MNKNVYDEIQKNVVIAIFKNKQRLIILMTMSVADIMKKKLETIKETASVQQTAEKMKEQNVSSLVVIDENGKSQGLVTERDLARKVCVNRTPAHEVTNKEIMSSPLITIDSNSSPSVAADMMLQYNVRHLLVIDKSDANKPIGIITPLDFTRYQEYPNDEVSKDSVEKILEYYI
ncbi:MAG TPA: CBS domain-containing protein [Candidatus Nitrosopolaris sp.]|nr:CBS domain-containing protein [Candidatus Nitrosopolaris sp.]